MLDAARDGSRGVSAQDRQRAAVQNALARAETAAETGSLDDALSWLEVARTVDGALSRYWDERRQTWELMLHASRVRR